MRLISIVIPVYKSTKSLEILASQLNKLQTSKKYKFEIVFVNDSPEFIDTTNTLKSLKKQYQNVRVITLRKNQGQHIALLTGMSQAKGDFIITMDDDLQHPPREVPKLIRAISENNQIDVVFAVPHYTHKKHKLWRNIGSYFLNKIDTIFLKKPKGLIKSAFRIMTRDIAKVIVNNFNAMPAVSSLLVNATENIINIEVEHDKREYGKSNYTLSKLINLTFNHILHYSSLPLKVVGLIGVAGFLFSLIFTLQVVIKKIFIGINFPGYASTVALISFFGGLNLFAVGIVGEYLIRIIKEQQKPDLKDLIKG